VNDILLTETERRELVHKTVNLSLMGASEAICRAQVRKVVEWLKDNCECSRQGWHSPHYCPNCDTTLPIGLTEADVAALKAAGGE
jgi:hypothetical protein